MNYLHACFSNCAQSRTDFGKRGRGKVGSTVQGAATSATAETGHAVDLLDFPLFRRMDLISFYTRNRNCILPDV